MFDNSQIMGKAGQDALQDRGATAKRDWPRGRSSRDLELHYNTRYGATSSKVSTASRMSTTKCGRRTKGRNHLSQTG